MISQRSRHVQDAAGESVATRIGCHLLLVEDSPDDIDLALLALKESGLQNEVVVARDGAQALDLLLGDEGEDTNDVVLPKVILMDINLPKLNGLEVLKLLRSNERTRFVPIVMLTTSSEESDLLASFANGANSFMQKPVDFKEFSRAFRRLGFYWLTLNRVPWEGFRA